MKLPKTILLLGCLLALSLWLGGADTPEPKLGPQSDEGVILLMDYGGRNLLREVTWHKDPMIAAR